MMIQIEHALSVCTFIQCVQPYLVHAYKETALNEHKAGQILIVCMRGRGEKSIPKKEKEA